MPRRTARAASALDTQYLAEPAQKALADRLARLEGHIRSVRRMVLDRRCADEILIQVAAVKAALNKFSASLLEHEFRACMDSCMEGTADERLDRVTKMITGLLKQS